MIKIVCINNWNEILNRELPLIINKVYDVLSESDGFYYIKYNGKNSGGFRIDRFITLAEFRNQRIDQILEDD